MAEEIKDADDQTLEEIFRSNTIADDGFSDRIVGRIRRRLWLRRLSLPVAAAVGTSVAVKPMVGVVTSLYDLLSKTAVPQFLEASVASLPPLQLLVLGSVLLVLAIVSIQVLAD